MGDVWGVMLCGWATGMFTAWVMFVLARRGHGSQEVHILPPRGGSVMSRPTVGPQGGTGTPPQAVRVMYLPQDATLDREA